MFVTSHPLSGKSAVGFSVGLEVGVTDGDLVGETVGPWEGDVVGLVDGDSVGLMLRVEIPNNISYEAMIDKNTAQGHSLDQTLLLTWVREARLNRFRKNKSRNIQTTYQYYI